MTKALIIAIALASITATAQTQSTAPAATTAQEQAATPVAKTASKKMKKKKAKPSAEQTAKQVDDLAKDSSTNVPKPAAATNVETVSPQAGTPAGTSAAAVAADAGPKKNWALKAQLYSTTDYTNTQNIQNLTTLGGSYKVLPKLTVKAAQTFETLTNGRETSDDTRELTKSSNFRTSYTDIGAATSLPGAFGSDEMPLSVNFKVMGGTSEYTTTGAYSKAYSFVETNFSIPYTISPKWASSIDMQWRHVNNKVGERKFEIDPISNEYTAESGNYAENSDSNRLLIIPNLTYTINDFISVYQAAGPIWSFRNNNEFRSRYTRMYLETGVTFTPVKNLNMTFMIDQDKAIAAAPSSGVDVSDFNLYRPTQAAGGEGRTLDAVAIEALITYAY